MKLGREIRHMNVSSAMYSAPITDEDSAPGWYDIYDNDNTLNVMEKWVINVNAMIGHGMGYVSVNLFGAGSS